MAYKLLTRRELEIINRKNLRYPLAMAEKDYFLTVVLNIIYSSYLKDTLVFKGGTAIHHCYLSQLRFSEDLDFTSLDKSITIQKVKSVLEKEDFLEIKKEYTSKATIKIERLKYFGPLELPNSLKVEIDCFQKVLLPFCKIEYKNVWNIKFKVNVMDYKEVCAEKIRAINERARYRDFYDLHFMLKEFKPPIKEVIYILKQKEIRKPLSHSSILGNWNIAKKEHESNRTYLVQNVSNSEIEKMISLMRF